MKERPILFSAPMMRAILSGAKTQTRRIVKAHGWDPNQFALRATAEHPDVERAQAFFGDGRGVGCPYGKLGDRLWVKETFIHEPADYCWEASVSIPVRPAHTTYRADTDPSGDAKRVGWTSPLFMPRKLSRITLEVTGVRVERLQDITDADAEAEGVVNWLPSDANVEFLRGLGVAVPDRPNFQFQLLWCSINGTESWDANPWVWVVSFKRVEATP